MNQEDLLKSVRGEEDEAIKRGFAGLPLENGPNGAAKVPSDDRKLSASKKTQVEEKFNQNIEERLQNTTTTNKLSKTSNTPSKENDSITDDGYGSHQSGDSHQQFLVKMTNLPSNPNQFQFPDAARTHHTNYFQQLIPLRHKPNHHSNRFYINQNGNEDVKLNEGDLIENVTLAGVINDPIARKLNVYNSSIKLKSQRYFENYKRNFIGRKANYQNNLDPLAGHLNIDEGTKKLKQLSPRIFHGIKDVSSSGKLMSMRQNMMKA